jgi:hypothetical protein
VSQLEDREAHRIDEEVSRLAEAGGLWKWPLTRVLGELVGCQAGLGRHA